MFDGKKFMAMFQTEEDWRGFYRMVFDDQTGRLESREGFTAEPKEGLPLLFLRMADARTEAEGEAYRAWLKSADHRRYSRELVERASREVSEYDAWLARKYAGRKLIHASYNEYGEFQRPEPTVTGGKEWVNDDVEAIA